MYIINLWWPARGIWRLRCRSAANAAGAEHFRPSSWPAVTSQQLNLADGKRAQPGVKSVPDDFLLLRSLFSALTPLPFATIIQMCLCPLFPSHCCPPLALLHPPTPPPQWNWKSQQSLSRSHYLRIQSCSSLPTQQPSSSLLLLYVPPFRLPQVHSSMTYHTGFHESFKVCCLWEPLFFMLHFSILGNTWLGRQPGLLFFCSLLLVVISVDAFWQKNKKKEENGSYQVIVTDCWFFFFFLLGC